MPFPYLEVAGTRYELGLQHGTLAREQVRHFVEYLVRSTGRPRAKVLRATHPFLPLIEQHCPGLLEEVRGLADGAGLSFEEALLPQIRGELARTLGAATPDEGCTSFAVSGEHTECGGTLIGQTSDMAPELEQYFLVIRLAPEVGPALLMWTFAGQLGYHGVSEWGVAQFANNLAGGPAPEGVPGGLPHYPIKRRLYECRTREEVLAMWRSLPVCSSGNYMLAVGNAIFDVEATPTGIGVLEAQEGLLGHANHFQSAAYRTAETDRLALPDSFHRQQRIDTLLREHRDGLTVHGMKNVLSDHTGTPTAICRHEEPGGDRMSTVAALIAEPAAGRLHVSRGQPCRGDWTSYAL